MSSSSASEQFWVAGISRTTDDHVRGRCSDCGVEVYFSAACKPASMAVVCLPCGERRFGDDERAAPAVLQATIDELADVLGITADEAFERANALVLERYGQPLKILKIG